MSRAPIEPTADFPLSEAFGELTGFEVIAVKKQLKLMSLEKADSVELCQAMVWAFENRKGTVPWDDILAKPIVEVMGYFLPEPKEPDDESGKG